MRLIEQIQRLGEQGLDAPFHCALPDGRRQLQLADKGGNARCQRKIQIIAPFPVAALPAIVVITTISITC
jgi:hypothetical protein